MEQDINSIKRIVKDDRLFAALIDVSNRLIYNWESQSCLRSTVDETALLTATKEAKIAGVKALLKELEELANK